MYQVINEISNFFSKPIYSLLNGGDIETPLVIAFALGLVGALAPCQLTANISAITLYGNRSLQKSQHWGEVLYFILGKITVFSGLGLLVWLLGQGFQQDIIMIFPFFRKIIGPFLMFIGFFLLGFIQLNFIGRMTERIPLRLRSGKTGSFMMGASFSIAFCPTMFMLFFVALMPIVLSSSYGFILPTVFGIATSLPLLLTIGIISYLGFSGALMKKSRKIGLWIQRFSGAVLVIIGLLDTITYWQ